MNEHIYNLHSSNFSSSFNILMQKSKHGQKLKVDGEPPATRKRHSATWSKVTRQTNKNRKTPDCARVPNIKHAWGAKWNNYLKQHKQSKLTEYLKGLTLNEQMSQNIKSVLNRARTKNLGCKNRKWNKVQSNHKRNSTNQSKTRITYVRMTIDARKNNDELHTTTKQEYTNYQKLSTTFSEDLTPPRLLNSPASSFVPFKISFPTFPPITTHNKMSIRFWESPNSTLAALLLNVLTTKIQNWRGRINKPLKRKRGLHGQIPIQGGSLYL